MKSSKTWRKSILESNEELSIREQCKLLGISRSSIYYQPQRIDSNSLHLMDLIDKQHTKTPFYGSRRITEYLKQKGYNVNRKRIQRLMKIMRIEAIYPKPNISQKDKEHTIYPYLLKGVKVTRANQVWSTDITYIRVGKGFAYLTAVMDWYSRYVLSWRISNTLENSFCIEALEEALDISQPEIFNTDQGSQYTANNFTSILSHHQIKISMDSKGRALDNVFVERLWRTVKYEKIYLEEYSNIADLYKSLEAYFYFYNNERQHQALKYKTPYLLYS